MVKSKNAPKNGSNKFRATITISPELHRRVKESGLNLSRFTENSLIWLFSQIDSGDIKLIDGNNVILDLDSENKATKDGSAAIRTQDLRRVKADAILTQNLKRSSETAYSNFQPPCEISISAMISDEKTAAEYITFSHKTGVSSDSSSARDYIKAMKKLDDVYSPVDLSDYKDNHGTALGDKQRKGLLKLFKFIETKKLSSELNGYPLEIWRANLRIAESGEERMEGRLKDLTDEEVRAARDSIANDDARDCFTLIAYSGARLRHLLKAFGGNKKRTIEHAGKDVIYLDVKDLSSGTKKESRFYFPAKAEDLVKRFKAKHNYHYYQDHMAEQSGPRTVNAASLRKWHYSLMLTGDPCISEMAADQIQGRAPKTVGAAHYANLDKIAEEGYSKVVKKIQAALPAEA